MSPDPVAGEGRTDAIEGIEHELRTMVRLVKRIVADRAVEVHPGLLPASYYLLGWLAEHGPARGSALAAEFGIDKAAVSRHVQHLADLGLVERTPDPEDGRAHLIALSPQAAGAVESAGAERREAWGRLLGEWSIDDLATLNRLLGRLNQTLG